ncbi:MAG: hypothetical protein Q8N81_02105, partial [bacterium]|nr:hypothetical protein [bacterium]
HEVRREVRQENGKHFIYDAENGQRLSMAYDNILQRDGLSIGYDGKEYLLDQKTGKRISMGYIRIERDGGTIIGKRDNLKVIIQRNA